MIEIKLGLIVDNLESFNALAQKSMPAVMAFRMAHILKKITDEYNLYQDMRKKIIYKYADKDENGNVVADEQQNVYVSKDHIDEFNVEMQELRETVIKIDEEKIPLSVFGDMNFTPLQMYVYEGLIEE